MDYKDIEKAISDYNECVHKVNSIIDSVTTDSDVSNAPYEAFEILKTTDEDNPNHVPYLYLRFVYLPYQVQLDSTKRTTKKTAKKK